ncbi:hypothetical protein NOC27_2668 [Nitrosococcus oceani AFC27]|nr:hypothetical protein NOC27_2668 [Nitrosococcus oceani AFC27]
MKITEARQDRSQGLVRCSLQFQRGSLSGGENAAREISIWLGNRWGLDQTI